MGIGNILGEVQNNRTDLERVFSCEGKNSYPTMSVATRQAYVLGEYRRKEFEPYLCKFCPRFTYHIGRVNENKRPRNRKRSELPDYPWHIS